MQGEKVYHIMQLSATQNSASPVDKTDNVLP